MGVFTFVCKHSGDEWTAKQFTGGDIEVSSSSTYDLQRKLVQSALAADSSGGVQSSFSYVSPHSAICQVIIGGAVIVGAAAAAPGGGGAAPAAEAPAAEKKEEKVEEEEDDEDLGLSLFD